jgi:hypothetical protein
VIVLLLSLPPDTLLGIMKCEEGEPDLLPGGEAAAAAAAAPSAEDDLIEGSRAALLLLL